jgi:hypothetical protein
MTTNSGLSASDAQYMICKGTYGGKQWSPSEKQAACQRYEELTHTKLDNSTSVVGPLAIPVFFLLILVVVVFIFYQYKNRRKKISKSRG